ncbi:Glyoxylase, beta-lactamase superfamily II [Thalassovita litoralis]|uniref:Glyoxylase, beta-lactamase superfamily II n=1 Tax=Thalassovita litoralis TaxID=1010611 RepID=A0A521D943_9RHOB|nr:MBL fold metallo-hydrolase [Thalassovita litoralis]SMO68234.1 Glyoxylase, beta-lactamase superfamily II [Thalassovita litoralis]
MSLHHPFTTPPQPGDVIEVRPGILWARLALPFQLDHVNIYFLQDNDGWMIVDGGISNKQTRAAWEALLNGPFAGEKFTGLIITHHHPDHIGMAGWLCEKLDIPMLTSRTSFLSCMMFAHSPAVMEATPYSEFYARHGMAPEIAALVSTQGHNYLRMLSTPPFTYRRLYHGMTLPIGDRKFQVLTGDGHCAEQVMLYLPEEKLFLAADQVIEKISPNVSVMATEPEGNPLGGFIHSLNYLKRELPEDVLVLSGHRLPFYGLHIRCTDLVAHHEERCGMIHDACRTRDISANDLIPVIFHRQLDPHQMSFAFSEVLAHVNFMVKRGQLEWISEPGDRLTLRSL